MNPLLKLTFGKMICHKLEEKVLLLRGCECPTGQEAKGVFVDLAEQQVILAGGHQLIE
jgi:hypothetical protein